MRTKRQRELHRAIMRRSRERRRAGRMYVGFDANETMIDLLTRCELLPEGDTNARAVAEAIARLLNALAKNCAGAPRLDQLRAMIAHERRDRQKDEVGQPGHERRGGMV
jgi:hypothetical protein